MTVQNAETPRRENQEAGTWEEQRHQANREVALLSAEPGRDDRGERTGGQHPDQHDHGGAAGKEAEGRIGQMRGLRVFAQASQARVYGNEGGRKDSFAEKILKQIGNAKRRVERVGEVG